MKYKGSLFHTLFLLLSVLTSLLIIIFVSSFYLSTRANIENEFLINRRHNLEQMAHSLEVELQNVEYAFNAYSTTSSYQSVIENPLASSDFSQYRDVNTQLNYFSTPSLSNTTYTLISLREGWAISEGRLLQLTDSELEDITTYYTGSTASNLYWDKDAGGMSVVTTLPTHSTDKNGIGIAHVADNDIDQLINNQEMHFPILIMNNDGDLLYDSDYKDSTLTTVIPEISTENLLAQGETVTELPIHIAGEEPLTLLANSSPFNNLVYVTALYDYEIHETLSPTQNAFLVLGGLLIIFSIGLSWILATVLSRPLKQLKNALNLEPIGTVTNEFDFIKSSFESIRTKNDTLELVFDVEKPALKRQFVLNALLGKNTLENLDEKQAVYNFPTYKHPIYYVLITQLDNRKFKDDTVRLFTLLHILEENIPSLNLFSPVVLSDEHVATILVFNADTEDINKTIIEYSEAIVKNAKSEASLLVSVGISNPYTDFNLTRSAFKQTKAALSYKILLGNQSIIAYEDIQEITANAYSGQYATDLEKPIFQSIQLGNVEDAKKHLYPFLADLFKHNPDPISIEFALLRFFMNLSRLDQSLESNVIDRNLIEDYYQTVLFHHNLVDIEEKLVTQMVVPMSKKILERTTEQFKQVSHRIKEKIHEAYDEDISLDTISEELNYNPNYLSSIFKKETGITFSDYLIDYRLTKAKDWLSETELTVKEIAEKLKYGNSQNFIRSFKKREQLTPGQYRKQVKLQ
ncbi:AraC family transcriptional regulator [Marinilactibacillus sp. XAAS-LB27]|uniref:helix-turn-helix transcriptional regulator n=1 Tax=Marinilactibacillus sp. XAAS-LB27 TaxID=3114538 RepID=UPI002E182358|nr:AraC family transcriptional regulator [Marinilactibacillus sp. XAAS-LB27]